MRKFSVVYVPIGVNTFCLESAQVQFEQSCRMIRSFEPESVCPPGILFELQELTDYLDMTAPDLLILQNITFANSAYTQEVLKRAGDCPILLWTLREPVVNGTRLRLNSMTGAYSAAHTIMRFGKDIFLHVFGGPDEERTAEAVKKAIKAAKIRFELNHLKLLIVGHTPQGFDFGQILDTEIMHRFGVQVEPVEVRQLIVRAKSYDKNELIQYLETAEEKIKGLSDIPENNVEDFARLWKAYDSYISEKGIGAVASRCWPDFFTNYGTPVCAVMAMLNDSGTAASCEADGYGALSMYIGQQMTHIPVFFGDPVSIDEEKNTFTFWHCGTAACSLARKDTGACAGVHCNRKIGPTLEFGCKPGKNVTVFRIGRKPDGTFRFFILTGEALDEPQQFWGTSIVVKTDSDVRKLLSLSVLEGWEPHFVVSYGNISSELKMLARMLHMEVHEY